MSAKDDSSKKNKPKGEGRKGIRKILTGKAGQIDKTAKPNKSNKSNKANKSNKSNKPKPVKTVKSVKSSKTGQRITIVMEEPNIEKIMDMSSMSALRRNASRSQDDLHLGLDVDHLDSSTTNANDYDHDHDHDHDRAQEKDAAESVIESILESEHQIDVVKSTSQAGQTALNKKTRRRLIHPNGYLKLVIGCMYSSKSTDLQNDRNHWKAVKGIRILVINYVEDKRYTDEHMVMTHNKEGVRCVAVKSLSDITDGLCVDEDRNTIWPQNYDMFLIDEGQFFADLMQNVVYWTDILKKTVFVYGLSGDFRRQKFGQIVDLVPLCDELVKKRAKCMMCHNGTEALYTWKIENNGDAAQIVEIGAADKYVAVCRKHYNRLNPPKAVINGKTY